MADTIITTPLVSAEDAADIALGRKPAPKMITIEEFRARYGHEPSMYFNVSHAARDLAEAIDAKAIEEIYKKFDLNLGH